MDRQTVTRIRQTDRQSRPPPPASGRGAGRRGPGAGATAALRRAAASTWGGPKAGTVHDSAE
jgi:hypothetical protein